MGVNGTMEICRRCEKTLFRKHIGTNERDGGYIVWDKFEPFPDDWLKTEFGQLCPECGKEFKRVMTDFFGYSNTPDKYKNI